MKRTNQIHISIARYPELKSQIEDACHRLKKSFGGEKVTSSEFIIYGIKLAMEEFHRGIITKESLKETK